MPLAVPISIAQIWAFWGLSLLFFLFLFRALSRRTKETGGKRDRRSRFGILLQSIGIGLTGFGPATVSLSPLSVAGLSGTAAVVLLMTGSIALFAASSRALGRNWSLVARTRSDHELVRNGPYARIRHPIYLGMLLFMLALAVTLGHWLQLIVAVPIFLAGTAIRTRIEDHLLEQSFGDSFRAYRSSTPALIPRIF
jgi:protein-S-isoprenylcysteine O-methyltransferase Ste14